MATDVIPDRVGVESAIAIRPGDVPSKRESWTAPQPRGVPSEHRSTIWIAIAGAVAYCSWPLAFLVNPSLAGAALASSFEGRSQPFSWLFILLDCFAGLCTVIVLARLLRSRSGHRPPGALVLALLGYAAFGVATAVDAVVPLSCGASSAQACAAQLWPLTPDDLLTGIAMLGLFVAVLAILVVGLLRNPLPRLVPATIAITATWCAVGAVVLLGNTSPAMGAAAQYTLLTLTSVLMLIVPLEAARSLRSRSAGPLRKASAPARGFCSTPGSFDRWDWATPLRLGTPYPAEQSGPSVALHTRSPP